MWTEKNIVSVPGFKHRKTKSGVGFISDRERFYFRYTWNETLFGQDIFKNTNEFYTGWHIISYLYGYDNWVIVNGVDR